MKDNAGSIKKNDRKEEAKHPDYKGSATIGGVAYWIAGWKREGEDGPWLSLSFKEKEAKQEKPRTDNRTPKDLDDAPPF
jgi:hypothetical protein